MKNVFYIIGICIIALSFQSCDHIENPFPPTYKTDLDTTLYPGNWDTYLTAEWPDFDVVVNDDPNRNALVEDFTGHNCSNCPAAATVAHNLHEGNPARVFVASVHASPQGMSSFQEVNLGQGYTVNFTNQHGLAFGNFFGTTLSGSGFFGNPGGTVNRALEGTEYFYASGFWSTKVNEILNSSVKVAIKAKVNYYEATKGLYLHTEVELLDAGLTAGNLGMIVYLIEDSLVGPQNVSSTFTPNYVHRDIMRGNISGLTWGRTVSDGDLIGGKHYLNYSYIVPNQLAPSGQTATYNAENMHLLIYVYDKTTFEIYQVIKKKIAE
jgi:hypothetical protein